MSIKEKYIDGKGNRIARGAIIGSMAWVVMESVSLSTKLVTAPVKLILRPFTKKK
jgi:hypothetical protein